MEKDDVSKNFVIDESNNTLLCDTFSKAYPLLNLKFMSLPLQDSRAGRVMELLDFKTTITNPYRRLVGGYHRNINVAFLIAEAMWIFTGRKDVNFLTYFNKRMIDFSDDGVVFHAPYGFRLRHWGVRSEDKFIEENLHSAQGYDQVADAIKVFQNDRNSRQVVLSIWNPDFDLGAKTKDLPCNDLVMLKIRDNKLITTIQNRSNDLHWGLTINIFQFSFLTEMISSCLEVKLGTQTHNSQSLHVYEWNEIATKMKEGFDEKVDGVDLYDVAKEIPIDFNFANKVPGNRLREIDFHLNNIIENLTKIARQEATANEEVDEDLSQLKLFSNTLFLYYNICKFYLQYQQEFVKIDTLTEKTNLRIRTVQKMFDFCEEYDYDPNIDVVVLFINFISSKLPNNKKRIVGNL